MRYQEIQIYIPFRYIISNSIAFLEPLSIVLRNMVIILMIPAKMTTPGFLKAYDIIVAIHDVTDTILSSDSNFNVNPVMSQKFGNSSISMREVMITSILERFNQKNCSFEGWSWFKLNN